MSIERKLKELSYSRYNRDEIKEKLKQTPVYYVNKLANYDCRGNECSKCKYNIQFLCLPNLCMEYLDSIKGDKI